MRISRNRSLEAFARPASAEALLRECAALDRLRRENENLYEQVRALFFLYSIHRFHLPGKVGIAARGLIPFRGYEDLLHRRFHEAIETFLRHQSQAGPSEALSSALAAAYRQLGFQTLADQVRRSVRSIAGNQWMFRVGHPSDHPLRVRKRLLRPLESGLFPLLRETTPVRMDLTHSGWSDIFFLGMDFPEGARVLNVSIDLSVDGGGFADRGPRAAAAGGGLFSVNRPADSAAGQRRPAGECRDYDVRRGLRFCPRPSRAVEGCADCGRYCAAGHGGCAPTVVGPADPAGWRRTGD